MSDRALRLEFLEGEFSIHRFNAADKIPVEVLQCQFFWVGKTDEELSVVCESQIKLNSSSRDTGWHCLKIIGPLDLSMTGVLSRLTAALCGAGISSFALSTFDTDYLLVKAGARSSAKACLIDAGFVFD